MSDLSPTARVMQILIGAMNSAAVPAIARLGIPDHLESGPKTIEELAHIVDAKPEFPIDARDCWAWSSDRDARR